MKFKLTKLHRIIIAAGLLISLVVFRTNSINGFLFLEKQYVPHKYDDYVSVIGEKPDRFAKVLIVSVNPFTSSRLDLIHEYYLANQEQTLQRLEFELNDIKSMNKKVKTRRDSLDNLAYEALVSLENDRNASVLRTDSEGRFSLNVSAGKYFIIAKSNFERDDSRIGLDGKIDYEEVWLFWFQPHRFEKKWKAN